MDRVEYLMRLAHDHCDDGDDLRNQQRQDNAAHAIKTQQLLTIARGLVELLERELQPYTRYLPQEQRPTLPQQEMPRVVRQGPREGTGG